MQLFNELFGNVLNFTWQQGVMIVIGCALIWCAIKREMEPALLLPMGFGAILVNLPFVNTEAIETMFNAGIATELFPLPIVLCGGAGLEAFEQNPAWKETVAELIKSDKPVMGIDLGHQVMALAMGGSVEKMHCGHRGANCPVTETASGRTFITSQNHGYIVKEIPSCATVSHLNINDKSCEGLEYPQMKAMSVQFIPEAEIGQKNFDGIYERFLGLIG